MKTEQSNQRSPKNLTKCSDYTQSELNTLRFSRYYR